MKIEIIEYNASNMLLKFDSEGIKKMLSDFYCFDVPNAKFMNNYKRGYWDGKIRLFEIRKSILPTGLLHNLINVFCKNYNIEIDDQCGVTKFYSPENVQLPEVGRFIKRLKLPFKPHEHQLRAVIDVLKNKRWLIESPTSSGKSLIIYLLSRWNEENEKGRTLLIVPRISLTEQMSKDFEEYGGVAPYAIYAGQEKEAISSDHTCVVSTWQSIYKMPKEWFDKMNITQLICDEVHQFDADAVKKIFDKCDETYHRVGLTGTFKDEVTHKMSLESKIGPIKKYISTKDLMDAGMVSKMKINCMVFDYDKTFKDALGYDYEYADEIKFLTTCRERNEMIAKMSASMNGNTLVMFNRIEHGEWLFERIKQLTDKPVYYVAGKTKKDQREFVRQLAENEDCIIVASQGVFSTGISIKRLHYLITAHPTKSKTTVLQSIGRILRKSPDGRKAMVIDIVDDLSTVKRKNFALKHAEERLKIYAQEKFDFDIKKVKIKAKNENI